MCDQADSDLVALRGKWNTRRRRIPASPNNWLRTPDLGQKQNRKLAEGRGAKPLEEQTQGAKCREESKLGKSLSTGAAGVKRPAGSARSRQYVGAFPTGPSPWRWQLPKWSSPSDKVEVLPRPWGSNLWLQKCGGFQPRKGRGREWGEKYRKQAILMQPQSAANQRLQMSWRKKPRWEKP
jgi:hypothetical protein